MPKKSLATPTFAPCAIDLVTRAEAPHILGDVSDATLYRGIASGRYPAPIKIGPNTSRWNRAKLEAYVQQLEEYGPVSATANFVSCHSSYGGDAGCSTVTDPYKTGFVPRNKGRHNSNAPRVRAEQAVAVLEADHDTGY